MNGKKIGQKPLRLLVLAVVMIAVLAGCGSSGYQAAELLDTAASSIQEGPAAVSIGGTAVETGDEDEMSADGEDAPDETSEETIAYEEVQDRIIVTADVLNVRKTDSTDAGIYVQLPQGEILERTGFNEEWCRVIYDGEVAYVAADMVELYEEPETEETDESFESDESLPADENSEDGIAAASSERTVEIYTEPTEMQAPFNGHVVAIDAGHQAKANAEKEPIGPNSETMKAKMPEGAVGAATGVEEYELTLTVAQKLETRLKQLGYKVVMIRNGHDVNLSNAERSEIANESDADIFIRLHANSMDNSSVYGALAMCMTEYNPYNSELHSQSYNLSKKIIDNICALTGTKNRGVQKVDNSSAINWCEIPVSVVEMGFLTNPDEDRWLQDEDYQGKIVTGIANAVDAYFAEGNQG